RRSRRLELAAEFLARFGAPPPSTFETFGDEVLRRANQASFGRPQLPTYDLARATFVISFGADFLGTWNSPVANHVTFGEMRQGRPHIRGTLVQVEPRMSLTGASADEWVAVKPGTEGVVALGLAHVLVTAKLVPGDGSALAAFAPDAVEKITGVPAKRLDRIARQLAAQRPAGAVLRRAPPGPRHGAVHAAAVNTLNTLLGSVGQPGGVFFTPDAVSMNASAAAAPKPADLRALRAQALLVDDANPVFGAPAAWKVRDALAAIPFIASFGPFI